MIIASTSTTAVNNRGEVLHHCLMPLIRLNVGHVPSGRETQLLMSVCKILIMSTEPVAKSRKFQCVNNKCMFNRIICFMEEILFLYYLNSISCTSVFCLCACHYI